MTNPYAVPSTFTVQLKPCCGEVLLGEECDCAAFAASAEHLLRERPLILHTSGRPSPAPSTTYPTPIVLIPAGNGLLKRAQS